MSELIRDRLAELRKERRWSSGYVGDAVGVSDQAVLDWERKDLRPNGKPYPFPPADKLARLAELYEVSGAYILGLSDHRSGIEPNSWVVDREQLEAFEASEGKLQSAAKDFAVPIPRRPLVLSSADYEKLRARLKKLARKRPGN